MPDSVKVIGSPEGGTLSVNSSGIVSFKSGGNTLTITENGTSLRNTVNETISPKEIMSQGVPFPMNMVPTIPRSVPSVPFAQMLPTLAAIGSVVGVLAAANIAASKN